MNDIIACKYMNTLVDDYDYPSMGHIKQTGKMPRPKPTLASAAVEQSRIAAEAKKEKAHFCMKKFQNIPSRGGYGPGYQPAGKPDSPTTHK